MFDLMQYALIFYDFQLILARRGGVGGLARARGGGGGGGGLRAPAMPQWV